MIWICCLKGIPDELGVFVTSRWSLEEDRDVD